MWYAKMYFSGEKEFFENDAFGMQGLPSKQLELPFLESLLTFLELDEKEIFAAKLHRARRDGSPLQELRPLVPADRARERGVL